MHSTDGNILGIARVRIERRQSHLNWKRGAVGGVAVLGKVFIFIFKLRGIDSHFTGIIPSLQIKKRIDRTAYFVTGSNTKITA